MFLWIVFLFSMAFPTIMAVGERYNDVEYFTNVSLPCNFTRYNLTYPGIPVPFKRYWILPNTTVLPDTFIGDSKFQLVRPTLFDFNLFINSVDDPDFGVYHCIMLWNNIDYRMHAIQIGLNEEGPYFEKQLNDFKRNILIGGICAGAAVLIILVVCLICCCRNAQEAKKHKYYRNSSFDDRKSSSRRQVVYDIHSHEGSRRMHGGYDYQPRDGSRPMKSGFDSISGDGSKMADSGYGCEHGHEEEARHGGKRLDTVEEQYAQVHKGQVTKEKPKKDVLTMESAHL